MFVYIQEQKAVRCLESKAKNIHITYLLDSLGQSKSQTSPDSTNSGRDSISSWEVPLNILALCNLALKFFISFILQLRINKLGFFFSDEKVSLILAELRECWSYGIYDLRSCYVYKLFSLKSGHTWLYVCKLANLGKGHYFLENGLLIFSLLIFPSITPSLPNSWYLNVFWW